jgi:AraC family transcriptional activator of pobA
METVVKDKPIPSYSLRQSSVQGNHLFEMNVCNGEFLKRKADYLAPHRKDFYMFVLVRQGSSRHWVDTTPYVLKNNTFYVSSPWQVHIKEKSKPLEGIIVSFSEEFLAMDETNSIKQLPIIKNTCNAHEFTLQPNELAFIEDVLQKMLDEYQSTNSWRNAMLLSYIRILSIYTSRLYNEQYTNDNKERTLLQQFRQLINDHITEMHQVADYARLLNITAGHLNDVIKQQSGKTAIAHIHERLVMEAKRRLFHTGLSAKEIAWELGFEDASYFNRFFKRMAEQTPATFRQSTREMYH